MANESNAKQDITAIPIDSIKPSSTFLANPEIAYNNLLDTSKFPTPEAAYINNELNIYLRNFLSSFFSGAETDIKNFIASKLPGIDYYKYKEGTLQDIIQAEVLDALKVTTATTSLADKLIQFINGQLDDDTVIEVLYLDIPLQDNPIFQNDLRIARLTVYAGLSQIDQPTLSKLLSLNIDPSILDDKLLDELVTNKDITGDQRNRLDTVVQLARLTDNNPPLIQALLSKPITSLLELASMESSDWKELLTKNKVVFPPDETIDSYIGTIYQNIETTYPSQRLFGRLSSPATLADVNLLTTLNPLFQNGDVQIINGELTDIDWTKVTITDPTQAASGMQKLLEFANTFRQLKLDTIINDKTTTADAKIIAINQRTQLLDTFLKNNPTIDIRYVDFFSEPDGLNWTNISTDDKVLLRKQLLSSQRMMTLANSTDDRHSLLKTGLDSASAVVSLSESEFATTMGFDPVKAQTLHQGALHAAQTSSHYFQTIHDTLNGNFKDIASSNIDPSIVNELKKVDGIRDLFGPQKYCDCEDCRSVLSPAAYFVDTMEFIKEHISKPVFIKPKLTSSSLYLKNRRNDLWTLKLTCENTTTLIPYLTIVDEVLVGYIGKTVAGNVYEMLSHSYDNDSFNLPFNLPLEELRLYLSHFGTTLFDIFRLLNLDDTHVWREQLQLSQEQFEIIAGINPGQGPFKIQKLPNSNAIPIDDVTDRTLRLNQRGLLNMAGISRDELTDLLNSKFNATLKNIIVDKLSLGEDNFSYTEALNNITDDAINYMQRVTRLSKKTKWSLTDLDTILTSLAGAGAIPAGNLDDKTIIWVGKLHYIKKSLNIELPVLSSLVYLMPVSDSYPLPPEKTSDLQLYEKVFDLEEIFGVADQNTGALNTTVNYHQYALNTTNPADNVNDPATHYLLDGLGISEAELLQLFLLLKTDMQFDANGDTVLDRTKLSLLYRHAKLAQQLHFSISNFINALELLFDQNTRVVRQIDQVLQLIAFNQKLIKTDFSPAEIVYVLNGETSPVTPYTTTIDNVAAMVVQISQSTDPDKLTQFKTQLKDQFSVSDNLLQCLFAWLNTDTSDQTITTALNTTVTDNKVTDPSALTPLLAIFHCLERVQLLLLTRLEFTEDQIAYVTNHQEKFGIKDFKNLLPADIFNLDYYQSLITKDDDPEEELQQIFSSYQAGGTFSDNGIASLAVYYEENNSLVTSIVKAFNLGSTAIDSIRYFENTLTVCQLLGITGPSLLKLGDSSDYRAIKKARTIVLGAFTSRYPDETERDEKLEPYTDKINVAKRNALCEYILAKETTFFFKDKSDIYDFFLLDVEMSGCFRTSRLVCAISSLQLYVTRVLANLEQSADETIDVLTDMPEAGLKDFKKEWEWRQNYREWEASRKVFLYPENYLEPETLDIKSPIFKELEDELLQGKITMSSAETAYSNYISKFSDLAKLKISGSFYDEKSKTYYLFGRTLQDPGQLYYRTWVNRQQWTAWQFMDLAASSEHVSGVKYLGKIFVFWLDIKENKKTDFKNNALMVENISYSYTLNYSYQKEDGKWHVTQKLDYNETEDLIGAMFANIQNVTSDKVNYSDMAALAFMDRYRANKIYSDSENGNIAVENYYTPVIDFGAPNVINKKLDLFRNEVHTASRKGTTTFDETLYLYSSSLIGEGYKAKDNEAFLAVGPKDSGSLAGIDYRLIKNDKTHLTPLTSSFTNASMHPYLTLIQGTRDGFYCRLGTQQFLIYGQPAFSGGKRVKKMIRISTSLPDTFGRILFDYGLKQLLSLNTQLKTEAELKLSFTHPAKLHPPYSNTDHLDFGGAYGNYFREIFFYIPFLIADNLNSNHRFSDAKWWYERIFDPSAPESQLDKKPADRNWRYMEFRNQTIEKMKTALTDKAALDQYKSDPFNAHAIARLRVGAYQKAIVMKYIDNLLDWGDQLFTEFTMESVNEATMLYMLAFEILGKRPKDTGPCDIAEEDTLTFEKLASSIDGDAEFLITLENWSAGHKTQIEYSQAQVSEYVNGPGANRLQPQNDDANFSDLSPSPDTGLEAAKQQKPTVTYQFSSYKESSDTISRQQQVIYKPTVSKRLPDHVMAKQACTAFCVPPNEQLLGYWDRVDDRLYKIRHCMNIKGVKKQLALFQPALDAALIAKAKADGLTLGDILAALQKPLPPYRFVYIIEKAKQFTQTVQGMGSALLTALEKKDTEQLNLIRTSHEKEILQLTTKIKQDTVSEAKDLELALQAQLANVQNKIDYYNNLIDKGLSTAESMQQDFKLVSSGYLTLANQAKFLASILFLIAEVGSPFSLKYGGKEIGDSTYSYSEAMSGTAAIAETVASSAGILATFQRREDEWRQQLKLSQQEYKQVQQQLAAAGFKTKIAERDLQVHQRNIAHNKEINDFYKDKFTSLGLYKYLSNSLTRLCREAYNIAFDMALQAEQVYRFEIDDNSNFISADNWQYSRAGLLSGERLLTQLHRLEKAYVENNIRLYEMSQAFSLALIDPAALLQLKQQGSCEFSIPEMLYDIVYPGQYNRIIKSVKLTIPCVVGPYTNISAKLTLLNSWARRKDSLNTNPLSNTKDKVDIAKGTAITTSSAQNDSGTFELNFRDERYLPFEGAGAISSWRLELPAQLRSFNYNTISDIIVQVSYTAKDDSDFRAAVENNIVTLVTNYASTTGLVKLFSMRYEFPDAFYRLINSTLNPQTADFEIMQSHFPYMFSDKQIQLSNMKIFLKNFKTKAITTSGLTVKLNEYSISSWADFPQNDPTDNKLKLGEVNATGNPIKKWTIDGGNNGLKVDEVEDILLLMTYKIGQ